MFSLDIYNPVGNIKGIARPVHPHVTCHLIYYISICFIIVHFHCLSLCPYSNYIHTICTGVDELRFWGMLKVHLLACLKFLISDLRYMLTFYILNQTEFYLCSQENLDEQDYQIWRHVRLFRFCLRE